MNINTDFLIQIQKLLCLFWLSSYIMSLGVLSEKTSIRKYAENAIERLGIKLDRTLEEANTRRRRSFVSNEGIYYEKPAIETRKIDFSPLTVVTWCVLNIDGEEVAFAATDEGIMKFDNEFIPLGNVLNGENIYLLLGFQHGNDLWLVSIQHVGDDHIFGFYKYSESDSLVLEGSFTLPGKSLAMIANLNNTVYMPILSNTLSNSILNLFIWKASQFDLIAELNLEGNAMSLTTWGMFDILFVAGSFDNCLKIFHFSESYKRIILTQQIEQTCNIVKHFQVARNHYLVCSGRNKILLYWWNGGRFIEQQEICDITPVVDIALMNLYEDNNAMVIVKPNHLEFYFYNSGIYMKSKADGALENGNFKSAKVWKETNTFYLLPVLYNYDGISSVIRLDISFPNPRPVQEIKANLSCVEDLEKVLIHTDDIIKNSNLKPESIWTTNKFSQIPEVHVKGFVKTNQAAKISRVSFEQSTNEDRLNISNLIDKLIEKLQRLQYILRKAVLKSTNQKIYGNFVFGDSVTTSNMNISKLWDHSNINGLHTTALTSALKKKGTQTIFPRLTFNGGKVKNIETIFLNSKGITDYLLLSKHWEYVKGHLRFNDLSVNNMKVKSCKINDIPITNMVTTSSPQNISCEKTFPRLSSNFITTTGNISGVNMANLKRIVLKDTTEFGALLHFTSDVEFKNMNLHSINGIDLSHLIFNSVKYSEDQSIQGIKTFSQSITTDQLSVRYINNVHLADLMTLHTPQTHYSDFEIVNISFKEIKTHSVNNIDLCKEAVLKSGNFKMNNRVIFTQPLEVDTIILKDGVTLDGIDVSNEVSSLSATRQHIFNESLEISDINVKNNVKITDARIKSLLMSLMNDVWLKTKSQNVEYAHFKSMDATDLIVNSVNYMSFNEIVLRNESADINSSKQFADVEVQSISLRDGITMNNIDFTSESLISSFFDKLKSVMVQNMLIKGNLEISAINNISIFDLMQVKKFQRCNGFTSFKSISVDELIASALDFKNINNRSFSEYVADSVHRQPLEQIFNKNFKLISGKDLNITGFLNGRKFEDFYESVVTLNSFQAIPSSITFTKGLDMKSATVMDLNIPKLESIVFKDKAQKNISHKQFQSRIYANKAEFGVANGVIVSNLRHAFLKSGDNWIAKEIRFKSNLRISKLQILSPASIDGVKLDDIVKVFDTNNLTSMNFRNIRTKDITTYGKINGCDLSDVREFLMRNISVKTKKFFNNLVVDGNLHLKNFFNGLPDSFWSNMTSSFRSTSNKPRSHNFSNIKVSNLKVFDVINRVSIDFLLKDAVLPHKPQIISGHKTFSKITADDIKINMLNVTFLNKLNFPLLYRKYLSKTANQMITLNLPNVRADEVIIEGKLNGVQIPDDVVLVHSHERIKSDVIQKDLNVSLNMHVGKINNIDLLQFLRSIVSVTKSENLTSTLTFVNDFYSNGDLHIINSLNGIDLDKIVKTSVGFPQNAVTGSKSFLKQLDLMSDFNINGLINNLDLENISENLCQKSKFEFFEDMVHFAGLKASSLYTADINKVNFESLWTGIVQIEETINDHLDNNTDAINEVKYELLNIKENSNGSSSILAYFELHQVLNLGFSSRFLPIPDAGTFGELYTLPTNEITVWINQNGTCRSFKSLQLTLQPDGALKETGRVHGRIFPFSLRVLEEDVQGFKLHVDRATRCTTESKAVDVLKTVFTSGNDSITVVPSPSSSLVLDAKLLETEDGVFLVIAYEFEGYGERIHVYEYENINDTWIQTQKFHSSVVSSFDMIYVDDSEDPESYLAATGKDETSGIYLYFWDIKMKEFILKSNISKLVSTSALWCSTDKDVFLLLAKEKTRVFKNNVWSFVYSEPVEVYVLEDDLKFYHEINIYGISSFETFKLAEETYVLAASPYLQTVYLLQYRGYAGFQVIQEFSAPGVVSASIFSSGSEIFLALASNTGQTRILKCVIRGASLKFLEGR